MRRIIKCLDIKKKLYLNVKNLTSSIREYYADLMETDGWLGYVVNFIIKGGLGKWLLNETKELFLSKRPYQW